MNILLILFGFVTALFVWWRFWFFMRNPKRQPPLGEGFLAPADGYVVYVKRVEVRCRYTAQRPNGGGVKGLYARLDSYNFFYFKITICPLPDLLGLLSAQCQV